jgi:23S rRNA (uracil1939-C5)-methyltransferase
MSKNLRPQQAKNNKRERRSPYKERKSPVKTAKHAQETREATLSALGYGGQALCKEQGQVLFVPRGLPGDKVLLRIKKLKKNYGSAEIVKVLTPSPHRVNPRCTAFEAGCGGCQWLHLSYQQQLQHKTRILRETLKHLGRLNLKILPILGMRKPLAYRNKLSLHRDKRGRLGLCKENTTEIVAFPDCRQELPANVQAYRVLQQQTLPASVTQVHIRSNTDGELGLYFFAEKADKSFAALAQKLKQQLPKLQGVGVKTQRHYQLVYGLPYIKQKLGHIQYTIPLPSFFQTNYEMAERMLTVVEELLAPSPAEGLLDLYSGVGFFSLFLAPRVQSVLGLEDDALAIEGAQINARLNGIKNAQFLVRDVKKGLKGLQPGQFASIILDPPRMGCEAEVLYELIRLKPRTLIYISCAPDTLARDLRILADGGYTAETCQPFDMFPQTYHIEAAVKIVRQDIRP